MLSPFQLLRFLKLSDSTSQTSNANNAVFFCFLFVLLSCSSYMQMTATAQTLLACSDEDSGSVIPRPHHGILQSFPQNVGASSGSIKWLGLHLRCLALLFPLFFTKAFFLMSKCYSIPSSFELIFLKSSAVAKPIAVHSAPAWRGSEHFTLFVKKHLPEIISTCTQPTHHPLRRSKVLTGSCLRTHTVSLLKVRFCRKMLFLPHTKYGECALNLLK